MGTTCTFSGCHTFFCLTVSEHISSDFSDAGFDSHSRSETNVNILTVNLVAQRQNVPTKTRVELLIPQINTPKHLKMRF